MRSDGVGKIQVDGGLKEDPDDSAVRYSSIRDADGKVIGHITVTAVRTFEIEVTLSGNASSPITATDLTSKSFEAAAYKAASMAAEALGDKRDEEDENGPP